MDDTIIQRIPGAAELAAWFGRFPTFHDAELTELSIGVDGSGVMKLKAFLMTDQVDKDGFFIHEKRFVCTIRFSGVSSVRLGEFQPGSAIVFGLSIRLQSEQFEIDLESSYGVEGEIRAQSVRVEFEPEQATD